MDSAVTSLSDPIGFYLREAAQYALGHKETIQLFRQMHETNDPRERDQIRQRIIEGHLRLVIHIADRYKSSGVPFLDLIQEGNLGLINAVDHFDWQRGYRFSTYAYPAIRGKIVDAIEKRKAIQNVYSLEEIIYPSMEGEKRDWEAVLPTNDNVEETVEWQLTTDLARRLLENGSLTPKEKAIIVSCYGFGDQKRPLKQIAEELGLTRQRVTQIRRKALRKLSRLLA